MLYVMQDEDIYTLLAQAFVEARRLQDAPHYATEATAWILQTLAFLHRHGPVVQAPSVQYTSVRTKASLFR